MVFTLSFNIAVSRVIIQHWQWQSVRYGPVKDVKFCFRMSNLTGLSKICSSTSALSWRLKIWFSASTLLLCLDCQRPDVPLPHFRSALTAKDLKFRFCSVFTAKDLKFRIHILCISTQFRGVFYEGLPLQRDEASKNQNHLIHTLSSSKDFYIIWVWFGQHVEKLLNSTYSDSGVPCQWLSIIITPSVVVVVRV